MLRLCIVALGLLAGFAVGMSDAPMWIALAIPVLAGIEWPRGTPSITWDDRTRIVMRGPLAVIHSRSGRAVAWADARSRRELTLWRTARVRDTGDGGARGAFDV